MAKSLGVAGTVSRKSWRGEGIWGELAIYIALFAEFQFEILQGLAKFQFRIRRGALSIED
jgi:hypothetical protein